MNLFGDNKANKKKHLKKYFNFLNPQKITCVDPSCFRPGQHSMYNLIIMFNIYFELQY